LAQQQKITPKSRVFLAKRAIWSGVGLGFGSNYTDISLAPSAIYNFNEYVALGLGGQYTYLKQILCFPLLWWQYYRVIQSHTCNPTFC
jgi:hypothetical protein